MQFKNHRIIFISGLLSITSFLLSACDQQSQRSRDTNRDIYVRADVSLKPTLQDVAENFSYVTNYNLMFEFTPSNQLLNTEAADSVDVFIFTNDHMIEIAREAHLADTSTELSIAYAVPCLIVPKFNPHMITALGDLREKALRIGIADPETDVLGAFSLEILRNNNLFETTNHRLIYAGPSAWDLAERIAKFQLDAAISWTSSVNWFPESFDVLLLIPSEIPRIAVVTAVKAANPIDKENSDRLMTYLNSDRCANIFRDWGYLISDSDIDMYAPAATIGGKPEF
jgi:molybdenum ABC transporter molybdate-binding protein